MYIIALIATKNRLSLLKRAVRSVLIQTRPANELIIASDSGDDVYAHERDELGAFAKFVRCGNSHNYPGNLNSALVQVISDCIKEERPFGDVYVAMLDDDDAWRPDYLGKCEASAADGSDFVVAGIQYHTGEKSFPLSIPKSLDKRSFLAKNPHIQGSNTFIRLSSLMEAGCFDECLGSTTDRDLFTRVLLNGARYSVLDEVLVDCHAEKNRSRLTTDRAGKRESLRRFYAKYGGLMDSETKEAFLQRASHLVGSPFREDDLDGSSAEPRPSRIEGIAPLPQREFGGRIVFAATTMSPDSLERLAKNILETQSGAYRICLFLNSPGLALPPLRGLEGRVSVLSLEEAKSLALPEPIRSHFEGALRAEGPVLDIAAARTLLYFWLKKTTRPEEVIWVLDEDMLFEKEEGLIGGGEAISTSQVVGFYEGKADVVVGSYAGDPPIPMLASLRSSLLDYVYSRKGISLGKDDLSVRSRPDYYHDLSDLPSSSEFPLPSSASSLADVFSGANTGRSLARTPFTTRDPKACGGNLLIFNHDVLDVPVAGPVFLDLRARRGDTLWMKELAARGYRILGTSFSARQSRTPRPYDDASEKEKLLKDCLGHSFAEQFSCAMAREQFSESFKASYFSRIAKAVLCMKRIQALLRLVQEEDPGYLKHFGDEEIKRFIRKATSISREASVRAAFDQVKGLFLADRAKAAIFEMVKRASPEACLLGYGSEGIVVRDGKKVMKVFYDRNYDPAPLASILSDASRCPEVFPLSPGSLSGHPTLEYECDGAVQPYSGGHGPEVVSLLSFFRERSLCLANIAKKNFILLDGKLKLVDYGKDIVPFRATEWHRSLKRSFVMLRYSDITEQEFKAAVAADYLGEDEAFLFGFEGYERLFEGVTKENVHDPIVIDYIKSLRPTSLLDYGAGKCKIINRFAKCAKCYVYDINRQVLEERAADGVKILRSLSEIEEPVDLALCNLVLCDTDGAGMNQALKDISSSLRKGGRAIFSFCDPFFDGLGQSALRKSSYEGGYLEQAEYEKETRWGRKREWHRPFSFYENALRRHGFRILELKETQSVCLDGLDPCGEHLVLLCEWKPVRYLKDLSLLIKTCSMDYSLVAPSVRRIVRTLEQSSVFSERIVVVDSERKDRARRHGNDDLSSLLSELDDLRLQGYIDRVVLCDDNSEAMDKWFGTRAELAGNGQPLSPIAVGLDSIKTRYVFQTDSDILYGGAGEDFADCFDAFAQTKAVTASLSVPHSARFAIRSGARTEVRSCFLDLSCLRKMRPIRLEENGRIQAWHRVLDSLLEPEKRLRFGSGRLWFVHTPNPLKENPNLWPWFCQLADRPPMDQRDRVDVADLHSWLPSIHSGVVVFSRGRNVSFQKTLRFLESVKAQERCAFTLLYVDDASDLPFQEYLEALFRHDPWLKRHGILCLNSVRQGSLRNEAMALKLVSKQDAIVINLDADDAFLSPASASLIESEFGKGADVTVGGLFRRDKPLREYRVASFDSPWERSGDNIWLHPKCFRRRLFNYAEPFLGGIDVCTDFAMMLPILAHASDPREIRKPLVFFDPSEENVARAGNYKRTRVAAVRNRLLEEAKAYSERKVVAVIGDASERSEGEMDFAARLGFALANEGYVLRTGGMGGIMEAVLKGARMSPSYTPGRCQAILPGDDYRESNGYADVVVPTGLGWLRNGLVVRADIIVAIGGGAGTLSEIAFAWMNKKPIIAVTGFGGWSERLAGAALDGRHASVPALRKIVGSSSVDEVMSLIRALFSESVDE